MPLFLSASSLLPIPPLNLLRPTPPRPPRQHRCRYLPAPLAASSSRHPPPRQPYRRRRDGPPPTYRRPPPPPPPPPPQHQQRPANAAAPAPRGQEDLEEAIYDFMRRSAKPGAFPTREELLAAGRADLAAAVASCGGWLALGWSSSSLSSSSRDGGYTATDAPVSSGGGHPDYPPQSGLYDRNLAPAAGDDAAGREDTDDEEEEREASPSGRPPETVEPREVRFKAGIEGMLTRLQRERERARPLSRSSNGGGGRSDNGALVGNSNPSHIVASGRHTPVVHVNGNIHGSHPQNGTLEGNNASSSSSNDAWKTWTLGKGGLSDFEDVHRSSNGVAVSEYPVDDVDSERDEIHSRLQCLELDLSAALKTLRSRFDKVLSDVSNGDGAAVVDDVSDDWEFEETKVMQAQEELRSIRAKIAVLEGKMALEIIERNKIIEEKQRRLDEVEKALSELRTVYLVWPNPASEVLVVGSFDGWTNQGYEVTKEMRLTILLLLWIANAIYF
ncbi:hypothetical protein PR202_gb11373 [Eleusine coracana subsp. coracana]|uniref:Uncharacterized protein n=1 Tax=Eleusine coracana subsp. coracana TaxID=191504 RepID=A0AAV5EMD9_ELECO|nr:hypothetical protein PR202_gb11373 [Eleusine coracana subsp. coracana]